MSAANYSTQGAVAVITLHNPPVNGLGHELRNGIMAGLDRALADAAIKAVVLIGAGKSFSGAAAFGGKLSPEKPPGLVRDIPIDYPNAEGFFQFARTMVATVSKGYPAPLKCIEAVAAAVSKPFEEGLAIERELFLQLMQTTESKALRHAFFAERAASKIPGVSEDTPIRNIRTAAGTRAGHMGRGHTVNFCKAGIP